MRASRHSTAIVGADGRRTSLTANSNSCLIQVFETGASLPGARRPHAQASSRPPRRRARHRRRRLLRPPGPRDHADPHRPRHDQRRHRQLADRRPDRPTAREGRRRRSRRIKSWPSSCPTNCGRTARITRTRPRARRRRSRRTRRRCASSSSRPRTRFARPRRRCLGGSAAGLGERRSRERAPDVPARAGSLEVRRRVAGAVRFREDVVRRDEGARAVARQAGGCRARGGRDREVQRRAGVDAAQPADRQPAAAGRGVRAAAEGRRSPALHGGPRAAGRHRRRPRRARGRGRDGRPADRHAHQPGRSVGARGRRGDVHRPHQARRPHDGPPAVGRRARGHRVLPQRGRRICHAARRQPHEARHQDVRDPACAWTTAIAGSPWA